MCVGGASCLNLSLVEKIHLDPFNFRMLVADHRSGALLWALTDRL